MGTQVTHEPVVEPTSETPPAGLEPSTSPPIQPIASPPAPPTDDADARYRALLEGTVRAQNERIALMERERAAAPPAPAAPPKSADDERREYFDNPMEATRRLIQSELQQTIAPLTDFVRSFKGASAIDNLVEAAKINPQFRDHWSPGIEQYVRDQAAQVDPTKLNDSSFGFLVVSAIGMKTAGMIRDGAPTAPPTPAPAPRAPAPSSTPAPVATPPYMAPSAPPAPSSQPARPSFRPLDETEKRLLREYNAGKPANKQMTEQQYREWQELPSESVISSTIGQPKAGA